MVTAIIVIGLVLIGNFAIKSYSKDIRHGCCGQGSNMEVETQDLDIQHYSYCKKIGIEGMTCKNCGKRIASTIHQMGGCYMIVDMTKQEAFLYSKEEISNFNIKEKIYNLGYTVKYIEIQEIVEQSTID